MDGTEGPETVRSKVVVIKRPERDEDPEDESSTASTIFQASIRTPHFISRKLNIGELCHTFSTTAWCMRTSLIASATETCAREPRSSLPPGFWIPVHIFAPERPTENATFNVVADSPYDSMQSLEWSPLSCSLALLAVNSGGRISVWTHTFEEHCNAARAINSWACEYEFRQDHSAVTKWISGLSPYQWAPLTPTSKPSFEERFITQHPWVSARWPNFQCFCTVYTSGCVQLHWRQMIWDKAGGASKWHVSSKGALGAGPSGLCAADVIVNEAGALLVAGVPIGNPSTVVIWEVNAWNVNGHSSTPQLSVKFGAGLQSPTSFGASWNGFAPLAASLLSWQQQGDMDSKVGQSAETKVGPLLQCTPISNLAAYVKTEGSSPTGFTSTGWGSGVAAVGFDPSSGGSSLVTVVGEGYYLSPNHPDEGPFITGWTAQRWESSSQQVGIHPLFDSGAVNYLAASQPMRTSWRAVETKGLGPAGVGSPSSKCLKKDSKLECSSDRCIAKIGFSRSGEVVFSLLHGDVQIFAGSNLTHLRSFVLPLYSPGAPAFSPNGCCIASAWHNRDVGFSMLKVVRVQPALAVSSQGSSSSAWERHLVDRFWWSLVNKFDWWDIGVSIQSVAEEGIVSVSKMVAILDADFHLLPTATHRQYYSPALDSIKCQVLEGMDATDVRALVLDMQSRISVEFLRGSLDAALINPSTLLAEPWQASNDVLAGLGADAMVVDPALTAIIQAHVDTILDTSSHFLTRLRRYASFCRTLSQAAGSSNPNSGGNSRFAATVASNAGAQGSQMALSSGAQLHALVQGAIAKLSNNERGAATAASSVGSQTAAFSSGAVSTSTFPGIPAVRLVGDTNFLHRLCQLLLFCVVFRKRQQRLTAAVQKPSQDGSKPASAGQAAEDYVSSRNARIGNGNVGQGYTSDEVKYLFLVLVDLCKRTASLPHPLPMSQVTAMTQYVRLHYIDGQYSVAPDVVETSLGPHVQNLPRPRGADAAGLLMRELELHPPSEEWNHLLLSGGAADMDFPRTEMEPKSRYLWPRKRRHMERNAACGISTGYPSGSFTGLLGSRRDSITASWRTSLHGFWHKCVRCGRHTGALAGPAGNGGSNGEAASGQEAWWYARWAHACPMCGGQWLRVV